MVKILFCGAARKIPIFAFLQRGFGFFLVSEYWSYVLVHMCIGRAAYTLGESDRADGTGM